MPNEVRLRALRRAVLSTALALLAGCAPPLTPPLATTDADNGPPAATAAPSAEAAQRRLQRAVQALQQRPPDLGRARSRLTGLLAADDEYARALHPYARALLEQINERQRLGAAHDRLAQELERATRELENSQLRSDELQRKLDALAEIERSLAPRGAAGTLPPPRQWSEPR